MATLFWRQFRVLFWKNWIVLSQYPLLNFLRCLVLPLAYGVFLTFAQRFLVQPNNLGLGSMKAVMPLEVAFNGNRLIWADATGNASAYINANDLMNTITANFSASQRRAIVQFSSPDDIPSACPQNNNLVSECYAAVVFHTLPLSPQDRRPINYTLRTDYGLRYIDVEGGKSSYEERVLPLQWAIDKAIIEKSTGVSPMYPLEWPFTAKTNKDQSTGYRLSYVRGIRRLIVLAFFIAFVGISFQLPGAFASERASLLTSHLKAMGLMDAARVLSWHTFHSLTFLPAWIILAVIWHFRILTETNVFLLIGIHVLTGLSLASHGLFISIPFGKSPQLAAIAATLAAILASVLAQTYGNANTAGAVFFTLLLPPSFYVFAIHAICRFEEMKIATDIIKGDSDEIVLLPLLLAALINVFLWPCLAVCLERWLYDARNPPARQPTNLLRDQRKGSDSFLIAPYIPSGIAISIRNLEKTYMPSLLRRSRGPVHAVQGLSLDIPRNGIFVLLGSNGAGKSTTLSILGGLLGRTSGSVTFADAPYPNARPSRGHIGVVPQRNVMFDELTCLQNLIIWSTVKGMEQSKAGTKELVDVLKECNLEKKIYAKAGEMSGGQKRKLQLAIGLVGGSKIVLVDECTSGVDPLSRRALWRILTSVKHERTIIFTTHFLDEADLLGDHVAILAAPGKLVASGSPVSLKSNLGQGYTIQVSFATTPNTPDFVRRLQASEVLQRLKDIAPQCSMAWESKPSGDPAYKLGTKDPKVAQQVLQFFQEHGGTCGVTSYDIHTSSMEDIFLGLMNADEETSTQGSIVKMGSESPTVPADDATLHEYGTRRRDSAHTMQYPSVNPSMSSFSGTTVVPDDQGGIGRRGRATHQYNTSSISYLPLLDGEEKPSEAPRNLTNGRHMPFFHQAMTIFFKRSLIIRRAWLTPLLAILVAVAGTTIPLVFITEPQKGCTNRFQPPDMLPLYFPASVIMSTKVGQPGTDLLMSPPNILETLGPSVINVTTVPEQDNATFIADIKNGYRELAFGGVSFDLDLGRSLIAWEAKSPGLTSLTLLNLASNVLYNNALNASSSQPRIQHLITPNFQTFPKARITTFPPLKWATFFGATMAVYPAFFSLYVSRERRSGVLAMQFSNGLSNPAGLWLGHLAFDTIFTVVASSITVIIYSVASNELHGLAFLWFVLVLYGYAATLFAYCVSLIVKSPLAAFAVTAGYQAVAFLLYLASYLLIISFVNPSDTDRYMNIIHFTLSLLSPIVSVLRAAFVSVNLFGLLCDGTKPITTSVLGSILRFGGPIAYLIPYSFVLFYVLTRWDSGSLIPRRSGKTTSSDVESNFLTTPDVATEAQRVAESEDALRVLKVSKVYDRNKVVNDASFGVGEGTVMALLGPNGAGKTTTFNMIRGDVTPTTGHILINGMSIIKHPRKARLALGVCPQFTAIDAQLSVVEHLRVYGRLKGLKPGPELDSNVDTLLNVTGLKCYRKREASRLSGGNQRKLALAIALMGNPSVVLIDEFSSGVDAKMKRDMWSTLRSVSAGKAVVITTHSMEEASALASKVGILARRMLAVGTPTELTTRHAAYEVHFACRTHEDALRARARMARVPGARPADDVATRFEVPVRTAHSTTGGITLAELFSLLSDEGEDRLEFTVERPSLESVFLKVIRENEVEEEDHSHGGAVEGGQWWRKLKRRV